MSQASEPSVEEILESIKKVIARDNRAEAAQVRRQRESAGNGAAPIASGSDTGDISALAAEDDDVFDLVSEDELIENDALALTEKSASDDMASAEAPLLTEDARMSMQDSFAALSLLAEPGARPQIVRSGETSLEGLVRELLRPALAEWLESNLPGIVERLVAAEIARIAGKRG